MPSQGASLLDGNVDEEAEAAAFKEAVAAWRAGALVNLGVPMGLGPAANVPCLVNMSSIERTRGARRNKRAMSPESFDMSVS